MLPIYYHQNAMRVWGAKARCLPNLCLRMVGTWPANASLHVPTVGLRPRLGRLRSPVQYVAAVIAAHGGAVGVGRTDDIPDRNTAMTLLNNAQAASMLGITPNTLKFWRHKARGPKFVKLGDAPQAGVAYDEADVIAWRDARKFASTSAYSPAAQANIKADIRRSTIVSR
jgi:predicted DNA-binding transcriptional regulator AlpA